MKQGFWANQFSINFYLQDEDGNYVEYLGTMTITFYLIPPFNGFLLLAESSPISPGETSLLSLQAIEFTGDPVVIPAITTVRLQTGYTGVRLGGISLPVFGIQKAPAVTGPYGLLTNTILLYEADKDSSLLQGNAETVTLLAYSPYDVNKNGATALEVRVDDENEILLSVHTEAASVFPQRTGGDVSTTVTVQALKENEPVEGVSVSLQVKTVPNSGGHEHNGERVTGTLENISGVTNENGVFTTAFTSSEIAGEEWIVASSSQTSGKDSAKIIIMVDELIEFPEGEDYSLTGANGAHPNNHYIYNESPKDNLIDAATDFSNASWNTSGDMYLNDISLKWGGLFDLNNNWNSARGHRSHRTGKDIDVENLVIQDTTVTVTHPITNEERERTVRIASEDWLNKYKRLMRRKNWSFIDEEQSNPLRDPKNDDPKLYWPHFRWIGG